MAEQVITNASDTLPRSQSLTGTVSTTANTLEVIGTNTLFLSELRIGDFLYDNTNQEIRRIARIPSNTQLWLENGFTNTLSGATIKRCLPNGRAIYVEADAGEVTLTFKNDDTMPLFDGNTYNPQAEENGLVEPFIVTAGSGVEAVYHVID